MPLRGGDLRGSPRRTERAARARPPGRPAHDAGRSMNGFGGLRRAEAVPWYLVTVVFVVLAVLIAASIATFTSVADAHARTTLSIRSSVAFSGVSSSGLLEDNGNVTFTIYFTVDDPTSRSLSFFTVGYKVWLEDKPAEAQLPGITRTPADVRVTNASGTYLFFPAFQGSKQTDPFPIPAHGNATMPFPRVLNASEDAGRFAAVQNITEYAVNV